MTAVTGKSHAVHMWSDAIQFIVRCFITFAHRIWVMEEHGLEAFIWFLNSSGMSLVMPCFLNSFDLEAIRFPIPECTVIIYYRVWIRNWIILPFAIVRLGSVSDSRNRHLENLHLSLLKRWRELTALPSAAVADILNCYDAVVELKSTFSVLTVMESEFGSSICNVVLPPIHDHHRRVVWQCVRRVAHDSSDEGLAEHFEQVASEWPQVVPLETKLECARHYLQGTKWPKAYTCSVCARELNHGDFLPVNRYSEVDIPTMVMDLHFNLLIASDCERPDTEDVISHPMLSKYMLEPKGFVDGVLHVCTECESELRKGRLPMFALCNGLYRGDVLSNGEWQKTSGRK
ncbi:hypothetical protein EV421DRAFT_1912604 [Armillaria borealis]|uniref:Uncharacterized protein n=1 Tax=Armillaria borealis TaxID=47425 RepID=A0AA39IVL1_9AGAR|nr:hypothetical protein EV421DRAFT_1912604 [Armillaria borealis]